MSGKRGARQQAKAKKAFKLAMVARALLGMAFAYRKATLAKGALAVAKGAKKRRRGKRCGRCGAPKHGGRCAARSPVRALGAMSVGATALGALAVGALAIGALAIKRLAIKRGDVERLDIRDLKVGRLEVDELLIREETRSQPPSPPAPPGGAAPGPMPA